jgi:hypothetical protein
MDDTLCQRFFLTPTQGVHHRYEVLRAFFVERLSYETISERFAIPYHTIRSLVRDFRAQCRVGQPPPFLPSHAAVAPLQTALPRNPHGRKRRRSPTAAA